MGNDVRHTDLADFHASVRAWFQAVYGAPTPAQSLGWPAIRSGDSTLILAPTGSGKTLAAFLVGIDRIMFAPVPERRARCRLLYVSPLKALAIDVEKNLGMPIRGVARVAEEMGVPTVAPEVAIRTGDTPPRDRQRFARNSADILITTPESLFLLLTSGARDLLRSVDCVIIDEIHTMVGSKRGAHLALSLERLEVLTGRGFQRIGLSATQRPLDEVARFLGGAVGSGSGGESSSGRPVRVVDAGKTKSLDLLVETPVEDMARPSADLASDKSGAGIWAGMHPLLLNLIRAHASTLIFVNSRRLAERTAAALNALAGEEIVHAHHGSLSREQRLIIEDRLKRGELPAIVATSSLELGIDMGAIDLVIQVEAPPSVASGIQRIGRAGHQVGAQSAGIILPKFRADLLACAALTEQMRSGAVEETRYLRNPLDVLAQQIVAMTAMDDWRLDDLGRVVRRAAPFTELSSSLLEQVLDMLSGRYPSDAFSELRPRITWNRRTGVLSARESAKRVAIANAGTIPDRGQFSVQLVGAERGKARVGELDEEMVFESRVGDTFLLGASSWRIEEITHDRVLVSPAPGAPGRMPFWHGESASRSVEFGRAIGALTRELRTLPPDAALERLAKRHSLGPLAAQNVLDYLDLQAAAGAVPDDRTIVIENYCDEMGDWRVCVLSPFGGRVHAPWAMAVGAMIRDRTGVEPDILWADDGIVIRFPQADSPPPSQTVLPDPDEVNDLVVRQLAETGGGAREAQFGSPVSALFASRFREAAARALLLPRRRPGQRMPLWHQRKRAADLLNAVSGFGSFPIILETFRECLQDVFDMPALNAVLQAIADGEIAVKTLTRETPSPFASSLLFSYVNNFIYEGDSPIAERRAQALSVDPAQLRDLLGEVELRSLLDLDSLNEVERYVQHLAPDRHAHSLDGLHDLLIGLGALALDEIRERADPEQCGAWVADLVAQGRLIPLNIRDAVHYAATEDAARYRDALGVDLPVDLPLAYLEPVRDPLGDLVRRYARTHGAFTVAEVARRFGIGIAPITTVLRSLQQSGAVVEGEFRPGGSGIEWCDSRVLQAVRRKSLARLRREVEPVDRAALGRMSLAWHGIVGHGPERSLLEVVAQLEGTPLSVVALESRILPARLPAYDPRDLDLLLATGQVIWVGERALGQAEGRIRLYLAEGGALTRPGGSALSPDSPTHRAIRDLLAARGASFFPNIAKGVGGFAPEVLAALWDLVWSGEVVNDTLEPLRALQAATGSGRTADEARRHALQARRGRSSLPISSAARVAPEAAGRWSLLDSPAGSAPTLASDLLARAEQLLHLYGIITRETVNAVGIEGGFSGLYGVLTALEEAGRIRRGYFVSGLGATQFALPEAVDRLRALREPPEMPAAALLSAVDPANPYGAALPWPERTDGRRSARSASASVALIDGALAAWITGDGRQILTWLDSVGERSPERVADCIAVLLAAQVGPSGRRAVLVQTVDGLPVADSRLARALRDAGFQESGGEYQYRGEPGARALFPRARR